jgi:pimeloyl-ACP methyl ester carboxylesterase
MVGGTKETDPARVTEYSEKDVMNVLALVRQQFNIDDRRIYLMGHSQGGGGARHLAEKYPDTWAAVALLAPALFNVQVTAESAITKVPLLLAVGDRDSLITSARAFSEQLKGLKVEHEYIEKGGPGPRHDHHGCDARRVPLLSEACEGGEACRAATLRPVIVAETIVKSRRRAAPADSPRAY